MNAPTKRPIVAWSYSALSMFENCPRKYWAVKIGKKVSDINQWNAGGDREHDHFQQYLKIGLALPYELQGFKPMLDKIKAAPGQLLVEYKMTLDQNFVPCRGNDWDKAWVRGASDVLTVNGNKAHYFDWKSGKYRESEDQIELSSLLVFKHFPDVQTVVAGLVFYKHGKVHPGVVHRTDEALLWNGYMGRVRELETAITTDTFPPTPNPLCDYCPYNECQYNTNPDFGHTPRKPR